MNEEQVVNQGATPAESTPAEQQPVVGSEPVETPTGDGKDYKTLYENARKALQQEREAKKALKAQPEVQPAIPEDETVKRFLQTEANAAIAIKLQTDPTFKDRLEAVQEYVAQGNSIEMADKLAKGDIMDKILSGSVSEQQETLKPKQITPKAIPEETVIHSTGNVLDDIEKGLVEVEPEVAAMLAKYRNKG